MEDEKIIQLYRERNEDAIHQTNQKYGDYCYRIAYHILMKEEAAKDCVNDTWFCVWAAIPPKCPQDLRAFLGKLTRSLALDRLRKKDAPKGDNGHIQIWTAKARKGKKRSRFWSGAKYLPVAACLCLLFVFSYQVFQGLAHLKAAPDQSFQINIGAGEDFSESESGEAGSEAFAAEDEPEDVDALPQEQQLPLRMDSYEGPVLSMTATGDTQNLQTRRSIHGRIQTQELEDSGLWQPVLDLLDVYRIANHSAEDKTVQLIYPFVTTLNSDYEREGDFLQKDGEELEVRYRVGESIRIFGGSKEEAWQGSSSDYTRILEDALSSYQNKAMEDQAGWNENVAMYLFHDFSVEGQEAPVVGVTVQGTDGDVFSYGFDYESQTNEGELQYSFFVPETKQDHFALIAPENAQIRVGYYTNLDCEEEIEGVSCQVSKQTIYGTYALEFCGKWMLRRLQREYEEGAFPTSLPDYLDTDMLVRLLLGLSEDGSYYDAVMEQYHTTELTQVFERLLAETRIVYAMATVTIPGEGQIQVTASSRKLQTEGNYRLLSDQGTKKEAFCYDLVSGIGGRLNVKKTTLDLKLQQNWALAEPEDGWKQKGGSFQKTLDGTLCSFQVKGVS